MVQTMSYQSGAMPYGYMDTSPFKNTGKPGQQFSGAAKSGGGASFGQIGSILQGMGSALGHIGKASDYNSMASIADMNSELLELDAEMVLFDSEQAAHKMEIKGKTFVGTQVALFAKAGVTFAGSPMRTILNTEKNIRWDILTMKYNAVRKANQLGWKAVSQKMAAGRARTRAVQEYGKAVVDMTTSFMSAAA